MRGKIKHPAIPLINILYGRADRQRHNQQIAFLLFCLKHAGIERLNYDHLPPIVPKADIPLKYRGRNWDIVYEIEKVRVYMEIMTEEIGEEE